MLQTLKNNKYSNKLFYGPRVGLKKKQEDKEEFVKKKYRALSVLSTKHPFKDKTIFAKANDCNSIEDMYKEHCK